MMILTYTIGPNIGPTKVAAENKEIAIARSTGPQKSAKAPGIIARADVPKNPERKRASIKVSRFSATATGIWKMMNIAYPI
jgi:hypothetical protein